MLARSVLAGLRRFLSQGRFADNIHALPFLGNILLRQQYNGNNYDESMRESMRVERQLSITTWPAAPGPVPGWNERKNLTTDFRISRMPGKIMEDGENHEIILPSGQWGVFNRIADKKMVGIRHEFVIHALVG